MPLTAVTVLGQDAGNGATRVVSPSRDVQVGEFIVVTLTERDFGVSSLADNSSQAGAANSYVQDGLNAGVDPHTYIYSCQVTRKILSTDTITATFGGSNLCSMCVLALPDANETSQKDQTTSTNGGSSSTFTSTAVSTTAQADEYAIGVACFAQASVPRGTVTVDSPWSLNYETGAVGYGVAAGSQVLTATGTPAFTGGWGVTQDGFQSAVIVTYKGTPGGAPASAGFRSILTSRGTSW